MTHAEYDRKINEVERLLNDPEVTMDPAKIWSLLAEISRQGEVYTGSPKELLCRSG